MTKVACLDKDKSKIREGIKGIVRGFSQQTIQEKSRAVCEKIFTLDCYREAKSLLIYVSQSHEVDTHKLIQAALQEGKNVYVPCVVGKEIQAIKVKHFPEDLQPGFCGILEPKEKTQESQLQGAMDLAIIPGVAFDRQKNRLGRGQGYFDRWLKRVHVTQKLGVAFEEQLLEQIPAEKHDIQMDDVITDRF